jgi:hypothetical protein
MPPIHLRWDINGLLKNPNITWDIIMNNLIFFSSNYDPNFNILFFSGNKLHHHLFIVPQVLEAQKITKIIKSSNFIINDLSSLIINYIQYSEIQL